MKKKIWILKEYDEETFSLEDVSIFGKEKKGEDEFVSKVNERFNTDFETFEEAKEFHDNQEMTHFSIEVDEVEF